MVKDSDNAPSTQNPESAIQRFKMKIYAGIHPRQHEGSPDEAGKNCWGWFWQHGTAPIPVLVNTGGSKSLERP